MDIPGRKVLRNYDYYSSVVYEYVLRRKESPTEEEIMYLIYKDVLRSIIKG
jgi:histidyl-tRNA synthetase